MTPFLVLAAVGVAFCAAAALSLFLEWNGR